MLFRRYGPLVRQLGKRILRDEAEADDLVQEAFFYLYRRSELYDRAKGPARSWILQVAYTQALLRRRKLKGHGLYLLKDSVNLEEQVCSNDRGVQSERTVEVIAVRRIWKKVGEDLTECQRQTLGLHFIEGYTFQEIAGKLGQSYANVRNHYYRGLEKLRQHLAPGVANRQ